MCLRENAGGGDEARPESSKPVYTFQPEKAGSPLLYKKVCCEGGEMSKRETPLETVMS